MIYDIIRSSRKTISLEIRHDGSLLVRAPQHISKKEIERFVQEHSAWINKHQILMEQQREIYAPEKQLTTEEIHALADRARQVIPERVKYYAPLVGVACGRITIRNQKTRWGSCSAKGNLNFNCLLMLMPDEITDYVVVHELAHLKEMNHSPAFWAIVEHVMPDYRDRRKWLKENGEKYIRMMTG